METPETLADVLAACRSGFDPRILDRDALRLMAPSARTLPPSAARYMGLEMRLDPTGAAPDLCVGLTRGGAVLRDLAARARRAGAPEPGSAEAVAAAAAARRALWARRASMTYLEYDTPARPGSPPARPGVFAGLPAGAAAPGRGPRGELVRIAAGSLPRTCGMNPGAGLRRAVAAFAARVPAGCGILNTGVFPARSRESVRMVVSDMDPDRVRNLFAGGAAAAAGRGAAALLESLGGLPAGAGLSVDVPEPPGGPRVGLELFCGAADGRWAAARAADWHPLLRELVRRGPADADRVDAVLGWFGRLPMFTRFGPVVLARGLNHVKVVFAPEPTAVKAYGGLAILPRIGAAEAAPARERGRA